VTRIAGPPYRTADQVCGPCYVLSVKAWKKGIRTEVAVLPAILPKRRRPKRVLAPVRPRVRAQAARNIVTWPEGRPLEWAIVRAAEPGWHTRARELRAQGLSIREIMMAVGVHSRRAVAAALDK
jgi:hypothetical protein